MVTPGEDMGFDGCFYRAVSFQERDDGCSTAGVVIGRDQERRRGVGGNSFRHAERTGIDEQLKIWPAINAIDGVGRRGVAFTRSISNQLRHFAACRETKRADAGRVDMPFGGPGADEADSAVGILFDFPVQAINSRVFAEEPVFYNKGGDADAIEKPGRIASFGVEYKQAVTAAGEDYDGRTGSFFFWRQVYCNGRIVDILYPVILCLFGFVAAVLEARRTLWLKRYLDGGVLCENG